VGKQTERVNEMIRMVVVAYDDEQENCLVCRAQSTFERDEVPDWSFVQMEVEDQLNMNLGELS